MQIKMRARLPSLEPALAVMRGLRADPLAGLSKVEEQVVQEIVVRLERMQVAVAELIGLNNTVLERSGPTMVFDPATDVLTIGSGEETQRVTLRRADPAVPIKVTGLTEGGGYLSGHGEELVPGAGDLLKEMEPKLEAYYLDAHRVVILMRGLRGCKKFWSPGVTAVRNQLIEHPPVGALYTFGYGDTGPRIKPMYRQKLECNDEGLTPNTEELVARIVTAVHKVLNGQ